MRKIKTKYQELKINGIKIPLIIRSYKTSKSVKFFFKDNALTVTKPNYLGSRRLMNIIKQHKDYIYKKHIEGLKNKDSNINNWKTGEKIFYEGKEYTVIRERKKEEPVQIFIEKREKKFRICVPYGMKEEEIKIIVDKCVKNLFKNNTEALIKERLPYWNKITGIKHNSVKVRDAKSRYGSCVTKTKDLRFSGRLIMLPLEKIDAVIVHELCHIIHSNHNENFYKKVADYISNYRDIDKWLNKNSKMIMF